MEREDEFDLNPRPVDEAAAHSGAEGLAEDVEVDVVTAEGGPAWSSDEGEDGQLLYLPVVSAQQLLEWPA